MKDRIIVFGSANVDFVIKSEKFPSPGGVVGNADFTQMSGGTGVNQSIAIAKAGGNSCFVGAMGDDIYSDKLILELMEFGVNANHVLLQQSVPTGVAVILVNNEGNNMVSVAPGANAHLSVDHIESIDPDFIKNAAYIVMQLEIPKDTAEYLIEFGHKNNIPVLLNFSPVIDINPALFPKVSLLVVNERETELLTGVKITEVSEISAAVKILKEKGFKQGIINIGDMGSYIFDEEQEKHIPAYKVEAVDTTSAGDAFSGSAVYKLVSGSTLEEAAQYANAAGAISVTRFGTQMSIPTKEEVEEFMQNQ